LRKASHIPHNEVYIGSFQKVKKKLAIPLTIYNLYRPLEPEPLGFATQKLSNLDAIPLPNVYKRLQNSAELKSNRDTTIFKKTWSIHP